MIINVPYAGLIAGEIHHAIFQCPNQAPLLTTARGFALTNAVFIICTIGGANIMQPLEIFRMMGDLIFFDIVYVETNEGEI
jgi:hypothetical protein